MATLNHIKLSAMNYVTIADQFLDVLSDFFVNPPKSRKVLLSENKYIQRRDAWQII